MDAEMFTEYEAYDGEYEEFRQDVADDAEWENIQPEDAHIDAELEDRYSMYDYDLMDLEDFGSRWDDDPNVYSGEYSEE